jgi:hypothetical protein
VGGKVDSVLSVRVFQSPQFPRRTWREWRGERNAALRFVDFGFRFEIL